MVKGLLHATPRTLLSFQTNTALEASVLQSSSLHAGTERTSTRQTTRATLLTPTAVVLVHQRALALIQSLFHRSCTRSCGILDDTRTMLGTRASSRSYTVSATGKYPPTISRRLSLIDILAPVTDSMATTSLDGRTTLCRRLWTLSPAASAPMLTAAFSRFSLRRTPWLARRLSKFLRTLASPEHGSRSFQEVCQSLIKCDNSQYRSFRRGGLV
jgi:hypothetical protein